jgi:SulP family sulfate permease
VALVTVLSIAFKRWWPRFPHVIAGMLLGSVAAAGLNHWFGADRTGITSLGALRIGLPPLSSPDLSPDTLHRLLPVGVAVALLALTEAVSIARAMALRSGQRIDGNQEFIGQGLSNLAGSFFSGLSSSGSFNRSGLNYAAGAQTPLIDCVCGHRTAADPAFPGAARPAICQRRPWPASVRGGLGPGGC